MAYIPPHKRYSKDSGRPIPTPELLVPHYKRNVNLRTLKPHFFRSGTIVYANDAISRWFAVGLDDGNLVPSAVRMESVSVESVEKRTRVKPFVMVKSHSNEEDNTLIREPWISVTENLLHDLLSSFQIVRSEMRSHVSEEMKPTLVARFGKILFHGDSSASVDNVRESRITDTTMRDLKRTFYTSVPAHYVENIVRKVVPKIGVGFKQEKDVYHVKLFDTMRPAAIISCKCCVNEDKKLELYKVELNQVRNMVADISCLSKDLDLRLMLCTRRILTSLTDDEIHSIKNLIGSAVIDPNVNAGIKWPTGKAAYGGRYSVVGVWHLVSTSYRNTSLKLKIRHANRYDLSSGTGETSKEVVMKLKGIVSELQAENVEAASNMLKDTLMLIWDDFLRWEPFLE